MIAIDVREVQRDLPSCLSRIRAGDTVVILEDNTPVAEIRAVTPPAQQWRPAGLAAGEFTVPDDFDAPLPEVVIEEFEGK